MTEPPPADDEDRALEALRKILVGPEQARIDSVESRLRDPKWLAGELRGALPEPLLETLVDPRFAASLRPTVEVSVEESIRRDPARLVGILFPIIGPSIRKAISESLQAMVQSISQALDNSISWRGLVWRVEAVRTGRPFAEVVLSHTLVYRVEQLFLIHRETSLPLVEVALDPAGGKDVDLVSSMLSAIQDFVRDSFGAREGEGLEAVRMGELLVWVLPGPRALLAAVIRGTPPETLHAVLADLLERVHLEQGRALESFDGDAAAFEEVRPLLLRGLASKAVEPRRRGLRRAWVAGLAAITIVVVGVLLYAYVSAARRLEAGLAALRAEPGIVVIEAEQRWTRFSITGLRDPLARDPAEILVEAGLDPARVEARWTPYQALDPALAPRRAARLLDPPATVTLRADGPTLRVTGSANAAWITRSTLVAGALPSELRLDLDQVKDLDAARALLRVEAIEAAVLHFRVLGLDFDPPDVGRELGELADTIRALTTVVSSAGGRLQVEIFGATDAAGDEARNVWLSQQRAIRVEVLLVERGVEPAVLVTRGLGAVAALSGGRVLGSPDHARKAWLRVRIEGWPSLYRTRGR